MINPIDLSIFRRLVQGIFYQLSNSFAGVMAFILKCDCLQNHMFDFQGSIRFFLLLPSHQIIDNH